MTHYLATIGLEIHAELKTATKMFCRCKNDPDEERSNRNICPVCTAQPGSLPIINKKAVEHVLRVGKAVGATLADFTEWDRKNYFYPDIPKGYQISQYKYPLVSGGVLAGVDITRIHLEEDTGTSKHDRGDYSLIDYNRAGVPLMELVTEPVIHDAETAVRFAKELQLLLRYLGASDANMEKGEMRVEANISIAEEGAKAFGTKVEVKNLNSFKSVGDAIHFELRRHEEVLLRGEQIIQETRGWDENTGKTFSQRKKETAHDYRYFPEPDLPKMMLREVFGQTYEKLEALPELPWEKRERYRALGGETTDKRFKMNPDHIETLVGNDVLGRLFDATVTLHPSAHNTIANFINTDLLGLVAKHGSAGLEHITPRGLGVLAVKFIGGNLSSRGAKDAIEDVFLNGGDLAVVCEKYFQQSDANALQAIVEGVIAEHAKVVAEYKGGKEASLQFLIGQGMKKSKGSANPQVLGELFRKAIGVGKSG